MSNTRKLIIVCVGKSCTKDGAKKILINLNKNQLDNVKVTTKFCFGKCGNGPIIVILPEEIWYNHVQPEQIPLIIKSTR
jgi:NADH:ubiquinone oxidoreductase subunit E